MRKVILLLMPSLCFSFSLTAQPSSELKGVTIDETNISVKIPAAAIKITNEHKMLSASYREAQVDYYVPTVVHDNPLDHIPDIFFVYGIGQEKTPPPNKFLGIWNPNLSKYLLNGYEADVVYPTGQKVRVRIYIRTDPTKNNDRVTALIIQFDPEKTSHGASPFGDWLELMERVFWHGS